MDCKSPVIDSLAPYEIAFGGPETAQPQYTPLHALCAVDGRMVSRWEPTATERQWIAAGADILLTVHAPGGFHPPVSVEIVDHTEEAAWLRNDLRLDDQLALRMLHEDIQTTLQSFEIKKAALAAKQREVLEKMQAAAASPAAQEGR